MYGCVKVQLLEQVEAWQSSIPLGKTSCLHSECAMQAGMADASPNITWNLLQLSSGQWHLPREDCLNVLCAFQQQAGSPVVTKTSPHVIHLLLGGICKILHAI